MGNLRDKYTDDEWNQLEKDVKRRATERKGMCQDNSGNNINFNYKMAKGGVVNTESNVYWEELMKEYENCGQQSILKNMKPTDFTFQHEVKRVKRTDYTVRPSEKQGAKFSQEKAPVSKVFKQFPLAIEQIAFRSLYGHKKYEEFDEDWMNWKRVPNAISEYEDAAARHELKLGEEETELEHEVAEIWNRLAVLQLKLENNK